MRILYVCEICGAKHISAKGALLCEGRGFNPAYEFGNKALYQGAVITITKRSIA